MPNTLALALALEAPVWTVGREFRRIPALKELATGDVATLQVDRAGSSQRADAPEGKSYVEKWVKSPLHPSPGGLSPKRSGFFPTNLPWSVVASSGLCAKGLGLGPRGCG
jgi:hypothetical protein